MTRLVTLLTDFGDQDGFVGAMKGVMLTRDSSIRFADIAHGVAQGDVQKGSRVWARAAFCFPPGTVHLGVIDPGVGSSRAGIAACIGGHLFVAPDNGLITGVASCGHPIEDVRMLDPNQLGCRALSSTFHGRDLFAPAAAQLSAGLGLSKVGPRLEKWCRLTIPAPRFDAGSWHGEVIEIDQFGNLLTNLAANIFEGPVQVELGALRLRGPKASYSQVGPSEPVLVIGSLGTLEVAIRNGDAAREYGIQVGDTIHCRSTGNQQHAE